jgi:hypothetical protein
MALDVCCMKVLVVDNVVGCLDPMEKLTVYTEVFDRVIWVFLKHIIRDLNNDGA